MKRDGDPTTTPSTEIDGTQWRCRRGNQRATLVKTFARSMLPKLAAEVVEAA